MSAKIMGQCYDIALPLSEHAVLMAFADHADHEGKHAFPGRELVAWKTGLSMRQVTRIIARLEEKKLLVPVAFSMGGRGNTTVYEIHLENGTLKKPFTKKGDNMSSFHPPVKSDILSPFPDIKGDICDIKGDIFDIKGDICDTMYSIEPLTVTEPSFIAASPRNEILEKEKTKHEGATVMHSNDLRHWDDSDISDAEGNEDLPGEAGEHDEEACQQSSIEDGLNLREQEAAIWNALAVEIGASPRVKREVTYWQMCCKELAEADYGSREIHAACRAYRAKFNVRLTVGGLVKHMSELTDTRTGYRQQQDSLAATKDTTAATIVAPQFTQPAIPHTEADAAAAQRFMEGREARKAQRAASSAAKSHIDQLKKAQMGA